VIAQFERDRAVAGLPHLLTTGEQRDDAMAMVDFVVGAVNEMEPHTVEMLQRFRRTLGLPEMEVATIAAVA